MHWVTEIITPAKEYALITDYAAKLGLGIFTSSDNLDKQMKLLIDWTSGEIAKMCNRTFARETVRETYRDFDLDTTRIWLTHYPVSDIESVDEDGTVLVEGDDYEIDTGSGKLLRLGSVWLEPVIVTYTGGYNLPFEAPLALQQAALLMAREGYYAATRGDATIRMVSHKDSRVIYFDPNARGGAAGGAAGGGGSPARRAVGDLLTHFMRLEV